MTQRYHILVVDDDDRLRSLLEKYLLEHNFLVTTAGDAKQARELFHSFVFDALVLDIMMPGETGLQLAKSLRKAHDVPILMLTAMGETFQKIQGLETGADDYLIKPFEPKELLLRLQNILRRTRTPIATPAKSHKALHLGACVYHPTHQELHCQGEPVRLTTAEKELLAVFARHLRLPLSRETLGIYVKNIDNLRSIDVQVTRLRKKLEKDPKNPRYLQTVRNKGYMLVPDDDTTAS